MGIVILNASTFWAKAGSDYYWIVFRVMATGRYWLTVLLTTTIALFPSFTYVSFTTLRRNAKLMEQQHSTQSFNSIQATISKEKKQAVAGGLLHRASSNDSGSSKEPLKANYH